METELCNMCMITDQAGRVLVQDRLPKPTNAWCGLTFPGGHVEPGENVVASVIREVRWLLRIDTVQHIHVEHSPIWQRMSLT